MQKNIQGFTTELEKFIHSKVKSKPSYEGVTLIGIVKSDEGKVYYKLKFNRKEYILEVWLTHIYLKDENRTINKPLIQYTISKSNFTIKRDEFILYDNKAPTIGHGQKGIKEEYYKRMFDLGFEDKIILEGNFSAPDFELITKNLFKWLKSRTEVKIELEEKYRNIEKVEEEKNEEYLIEANEDEFPEGKVEERIHTARERNPKVIAIAKTNFKKKHGKLFCQICGFEFEKIYGEVGKDFIEGHHTIAVSEMLTGHKTNPDDIAMLCSNCHRMVHKRRPWLTMSQLTKLLNK